MKTIRNNNLIQLIFLILILVGCQFKKGYKKIHVLPIEVNKNYELNFIEKKGKNLYIGGSSGIEGESIIYKVNLNRQNSEILFKEIAKENYNSWISKILISDNDIFFLEKGINRKKEISDTVYFREFDLRSRKYKISQNKFRN